MILTQQKTTIATAGQTISSYLKAAKNVCFTTHINTYKKSILQIS